MKDRKELDERRREVDTLERRLVLLEDREAQTQILRDQGAADQRSGVAEKEREIAELKARMDAERAAWLAEKAALQLGGASKAELEQGADALQELMQNHGMLVYSRDRSMCGLATSIGRHVEDLKTKVDSHAKT